jgi:hypothetical protein
VSVDKVVSSNSTAAPNVPVTRRKMMMGFWTALLAILAFVYDLPYMHVVIWVILDILILVFALSLLPLTVLLLLAIAGFISSSWG